MGFNKRYLTEDTLRRVFKDDGYTGLIRYVTKPDMLVVRDDFSSEVVRLIDEQVEEEKKFMNILTIMNNE